MIETKRLIIRKIILSDVEQLHKLLSNSEVMRFSVSGPMSFKRTEQFVQDTIKSYDKYQLAMWAVELKDNGAVIGISGFFVLNAQSEHELEYEIGFRLLPEHQGHGLATEAAEGITQYAFDKIKIKKFVAFIVPENLASIRVAEKIGMHYVCDELYKGIPARVYEIKQEFISTERLILRAWQDADIVVFTEINQDPEVIQFLAGPLMTAQAKEFINKANKHLEEHGFGLWAVELKGTQELIGFVGLRKIDFDLPFCPAVEIGWRIGSQYWQHGYATEAARKALEIGFMDFNLPEIVSFTVPANIKSIRVMGRLGMKRDMQGDFYHTALPKNHPLALHVLYRLSKQEYLNAQS